MPFSILLTDDLDLQDDVICREEKEGAPSWAASAPSSAGEKENHYKRKKKKPS